MAKRRLLAAAALAATILSAVPVRSQARCTMVGTGQRDH